MMIHSFNQKGQMAVGSFQTALSIEGHRTEVLFHVIDAPTTYNALLGRPWLHANYIVPSTLHQCFKFYKGGKQDREQADPNPFTEAEAHLADAKFNFSTKCTPSPIVKDLVRPTISEPSEARSELTEENTERDVGSTETEVTEE